MATFIISWAVQLGDKLQLTSEAATQKGSIPMIIMSVVTFIAFPFVGIMLDKWGRLSTIILTLVSGGIGLVIIGSGPGPFAGLTYVAVVLVGFGIAGSHCRRQHHGNRCFSQGAGGVYSGWAQHHAAHWHAVFSPGRGGYLFDVLGPGWAFGLKGAANLVLAIWLFMARKSINNDLAEHKATAR